ncbi:TRM11 family SAM-dependent methyltransferase [Paenibacillus protaetiae]|uniref:RNA methyltransferase n=1 Tax=Paenibacillus protaetiae TaxID=2509456 RepID=A0A4P6F8X9_9BACL|nr:RNA methyltransferase [Paenibacillus protaetiae]QAY66908.1 RNA methyltransferase [Paenibacillus protaetiae]
MYIYSYVCHEDEWPLCSLELRMMFGRQPEGGSMASGTDFDVNRSPFIKRKLTVTHQGERDGCLETFVEWLTNVDTGGGTFKVVCYTTDENDPLSYEEQRAVERLAGSKIRGKADMRSPQAWFGLTKREGRWLFGRLEENNAIWLRNQNKPRQYSTALGTRTARAAVSIAVSATGLAAPRLIDPCCGIGTVLIEAASMGLTIDGNDRNPLAVQGARENLAFFGYTIPVTLSDMRGLHGSYDGAVIDLPYNRCSVLPAAERLEMLRGARKLAARAVVIATDPIADELRQARFSVIDGCELAKGSFIRHIYVAE